MKRFFKSGFLANKSGSIMPIFVVTIALLIPVIGSAVDYSRILTAEQKLQFAADIGVDAALAEGKYGNQFKLAADEFIAANLPENTKFESRHAMLDGKLVLEARSLVTLPILALAGHPEKYVYVSTPIPVPVQPSKRTNKYRYYTKDQLRDLKNVFDRRISKMPSQNRAESRKRYDGYLKQLYKRNRAEPAKYIK